MSLDLLNCSARAIQAARNEITHGNREAWRDWCAKEVSENGRMPALIVATASFGKPYPITDAAFMLDRALVHEGYELCPQTSSIVTAMNTYSVPQLRNAAISEARLQLQGRNTALYTAMQRTAREFPIPAAQRERTLNQGLLYYHILRISMGDSTLS